MEKEKKNKNFFYNILDEIKKTYGEKLIFPKRIFYLGGAPGAGKGVNTACILKILNICVNPIVTSDLLQSPEAKVIKDTGELVGDKEVISLLFFELLKDKYIDGVVVDGFPRTSIQVEALKFFEEVMNKLHFKNCQFPKADFRIILFNVNESESIRRQLIRGDKIKEKKKKGVLLEELRVTDTDSSAAGRRYKVFKETTFETLDKLKNIFKFYAIDASGTLEEVRNNIKKVLKVGK